MRQWRLYLPSQHLFSDGWSFYDSLTVHTTSPWQCAIIGVAHPYSLEGVHAGTDWPQVCGNADTQSGDGRQERQRHREHMHLCIAHLSGWLGPLPCVSHLASFVHQSVSKNLSSGSFYVSQISLICKTAGTALLSCKYYVSHTFQEISSNPDNVACTIECLAAIPVPALPAATAKSMSTM